MTYSELNKKPKWTQKEALKMLIYCASTLRVLPSKSKIAKAKKSIK